ncbi:MAG TPA: sulfotransferase domain-containing protein [Acidimicrobiales bacterium]|jgi:aryl sulfotransferase|nr:sulfotransferase domain-containing protein [Acidimicrobiales bacterium]
MGPVLPATRCRQHVFDDSRRWDQFTARSDDIFITTPPKSGTTWTQGIVASLLWPHGDAPGPAFELSPWLDARIVPVEDTMARVDAIPHRRFIKTHSPADCTPIFTECRYLAVYRDGLDALMSWANHRRKMRPEVIGALNAIASCDGVTAWPPVWEGDLDQLFDEWVDWGTPMEHLASWWPNRHEPFVLLVHYADLIGDLDGEMRRIADFLEIDIPASLWADVVERCSFEAMKAQHQASTILNQAFSDGATAFFNRGMNGGGRADLSEAHLRRHHQLTAEHLPEDAAEWLEHGSLALGQRP